MNILMAFIFTSSLLLLIFIEKIIKIPGATILVLAFTLASMAVLITAMYFEGNNENKTD